MTLLAGTRLGPYEILSPLGAGGMGEVYKALDSRLDREVAIKVLPQDLADDAGALARFEREAKAVAALSHPNILAVHDFGKSGPTTYAVMELLEGESLASRLSAGALPLRKATEIAREIALGLAAAHEKGIVHRDLKPANLFLTGDGRLKILDFGLARHVTLPSAEASHTPTAGPGTEPGTILGTVGYMAPEQLRGQPADARSDIFSFGAVLYEMLAGARAFQGASAIETMNAILKDDPPELTRAGRPIPAGLERVVLHCLEKRPEERFQSARDLAFDLGSLSTSTPAAGIGRDADVSGSRSRRRALFAAAGTAALLLAFWSGHMLWRSSGDTELRFQRLTFRRGNLLSAYFAPDGETVVYGAAWGGKPAELFSVRTDSRESRPLGLEGADVLSISSNGELAVKLRKGSFQIPDALGTLARVPLGGGAPREILENVLSAAWTPGGEDLVVTRLSPDGKYRIEWPIGHALYESFFLGPALAVSPRGDQVAFVEANNAGQQAIWTIDRSGKKRLLTQGWTGVGRLAWSRRTGNLLFVGAHTKTDPALRALSPDGKDRVLWRPPPGFELHDVAADGRLLLERFIDRRSVVWMAPGAAQEKDLGWLDGTDLRMLSPDGTHILFSEEGEGAGPRHGTYLRPIDGGPAVRLGDGIPQAFSPDGHWVLTITESSPPELVLLPTGPGAPRKIASPGVNPTLARFSNGGKDIFALSTSPGQPTEAYSIPVDGGAPTKLENVSKDVVNWDAHGEVSSDGKLAVYSTTDRKIMLGRNGEEAAPLPGALMAPGEFITVFSPDRRSFETQTQTEIPARIYRTDLDTGVKTLWKEVEPADPTGVIGIGQVEFNADQTGYAYTYRRAEASDLYVVSGLLDRR